MSLPRLRATTPFSTISTNDPRPRWDVSVRLIPVEFESGSFSRENKRRISKIPIAPNHSVRGYVIGKDNIKKVTPELVRGDNGRNDWEKKRGWQKKEKTLKFTQNT